VKLNIHVTVELQGCFHSNTKIFCYSTYWQQVLVTRLSSGHHYIKFKTGYTKRTLISCCMGSHNIYTNVKSC